MPFLYGQIQLIDPKIILTLGDIAGGALLGVKKDIEGLRKNNYYRLKDAYIYVTYHPAVLIKNNYPDQKKMKKLVWEDIKQIRRKYDETVGDKPQWQ